MSRSWWTMPKVRVTTEEPSPLPLHTLPPCLFKLSTTYPYTPPSYNWLFSPTRTLSFTHLHFLHKLFTFPSLKMTKIPRCILFIHSLLLSHFTPSAQVPMQHLSYMPSFLTLPSYQATYSSQITYFHSTHFWLLCLTLCSSLWSICQCWQENIVP